MPPTLMSTDDIAGARFAGGWNNAWGAAGHLPLDPDLLRTSDGTVSDLTFDWASGGARSSGRGHCNGDGSPLERLSTN